MFPLVNSASRGSRIKSSIKPFVLLRYILFLSFFFIHTADLSAQDTTLIDFVYTDVNGNKATKKVQQINYVGMIYPKIYEKTINGTYFNGLNLRDSILVLNFWDTHCAPCIAEMPGLNKLQQDFKNKPVAFLALSMDDPKIVLEKFIATKRFELRQLFYDNEVKKQTFYCAPEFPTTIIVDRNSKVAYITEGGLTDENAPKEIYTKIAAQLHKLLQ